MKHLLQSSLAAGLAVVTFGCASSSTSSSSGGGGYTTTTRASTLPVVKAGEVGWVGSSKKGEIIGIQDVIIEAQSSTTGSSSTGARMGSAAATGIITGNPTSAASAVGGIIGSKVGARADDRLGDELLIQLDEGGPPIRTVVPKGREPFVLHAKVNVHLQSNGRVQRVEVDESLYLPTDPNRKK